MHNSGIDWGGYYSGPPRRQTSSTDICPLGLLFAPVIIALVILQSLSTFSGVTIAEYKEAVAVTIPASSEVLDLSSTSPTELIIDKTNKVGYIYLSTRGVYKLAEEGKWEHRYAIITGYRTTPNLFTEYKEKYGIENLVIYKSTEVGIKLDTTLQNIKVIPSLN